MRRVILIVVTVACAIGLGAFVATSGSAQQKAHVKNLKPQNKKSPPGQAKKPSPSPSPFPIYNPYPPGIVPNDINSELARVLGEIDVIEARAIARWQA